MKTKGRIGRKAVVATASAWSLLAMIISAGCGPRPADRADGRSGIDGSAAYATVVELSGKRYAGRLIGSDGSLTARTFLSARLERAGLPVDIIEFSERVGLNDGQAFLELVPAGEATGKAGQEQFSYRTDFREVLRGGYQGGQATGPLHELTEKGATFPAGSILLVPARLYDSGDIGGYAAAGAAGLLLELPAGTPAQRPLWAGQAPGTLVSVKSGMPMLALSAEAFGRLESMASPSPAGILPAARFSSPVRFADVTGHDLLARWNGNGGAFEPSLVVMAHYDHVGTDPDGSFFPGAHDNASGVSIALGIAEAASADGLCADLAFLFTDGEESGLSGARAFVSQRTFSLAGVTVINIDMAGSSSDTAYSVYSSGGDSSLALSRAAGNALRAVGLHAQPEHPVYNVDHFPFAQAGAAAITVCEYYTGVYHTRDDTADRIDPAELDAVGDALYALVLDRLGR